MIILTNKQKTNLLPHCTRRIGDINELKACTWLLEKGYEVYKNISSTGKVDIVIFKDSKYIPIQIKGVVITNINGYLNLKFRYKGMNEDIKNGIKPLWVYLDQVGWNRDYFNEDLCIDHWKTINNQHIT